MSGQPAASVTATTASVIGVPKGPSSASMESDAMNSSYRRAAVAGSLPSSRVTRRTSLPPMPPISFSISTPSR